MKELERQVSHDRKLREFMKLKTQERQEDEELVAYRKRKGSMTISRKEKRVEKWIDCRKRSERTASSRTGRTFSRSI